MMRKIFLFSLIFLFSFVFFASAQTVDEIIKKNIEARGGLDKITAVKSMKVTGKLLTQGIEAPVIMFIKRPNLIRMEFTLQGQSMIRAYNGETAWWINPFTGLTDPQKLPEEQAEDLIEQADMDGSLINYKEKGHQVELIGKEDMEGTEVYKLKLTLKNGNTRYLYIDSEYFLEIKVVAKIKRQGSEIEVENYVSDYKEVNGLMLPFSFDSKIGGNTTEQVTIEKYEMNVDIDDAIFNMPVPEKKQETPQE